MLMQPSVGSKEDCARAHWTERERERGRERERERERELEFENFNPQG